MGQKSRLALTELIASIPLTPAQSAAVVWLVSGRLERWIAAKDPADLVVPAIKDISVARGGHVWWFRGRVVPRQDLIAALGSLLESLLDQSPRGRAPAGLLYILARATEQRHLAPLGSLADFRSAVARHAPEEPALAVDGLLSQYLMTAAGVPPLDERSTISDVRRRRRAGGVALDTIARDTGIPISLLRELEWGVYSNWSLTHARPSLDAYAERAGLDPIAVAAIVIREQAAEQAAVARRDAALAAADGTAATRMIPFAMAGLLLLMAALAPPSAHREPDAGTATAAGQDAGAPAPAAPRPPAAPRKPIPAADTRIDAPAATPASSTRSANPGRRSRQTATSARVRSAPQEKPANPIVRLARTIAGDGKHKVEPFPRPR
ncbi:MAG TPA: hypothetical protein VK886_08865 [Vicinamibacterales bacterium]|nr:hypothetical protein [Vicinamibacterales bacterium]